MLPTGPAPFVLIPSHGGWTGQERTSHKFSSGPSVYPPDRSQPQGPGAKEPHGVWGHGRQHTHPEEQDTHPSSS